MATPHLDETSPRALNPTSRSEVLVALGVFVAMCAAVLLRAPQLLEPDDFAYRASIVALSEGHLLLTNAQYLALEATLSLHGGGGILQWVHLANGKWISQKNPGYPFFAVVFQLLHVLRWAPLFYGGAACAALFYGARRWLGAWGGTYAVALYCSSGAALVFAWRATMSTFCDASLIAVGAGLLLGVLLSLETSAPKRCGLGIVAFFALNGAVLIRYSDVVTLVVALVAVLALARPCALPQWVLSWWLGAVALFAVGDALLNRYLYGSFTKTGYAPGLITFSARAIVPNLERMPSRLLESMPMVVLAAMALVWIVGNLLRDQTHEPVPDQPRHSRRDASVALVLAGGWLAIWGLYATYTWTVAQTLGPGSPVHVVRFYVPAIGLISLIAAWFVARLPRWLPAVPLTLVASLGLWSYLAPSNHAAVTPPAARHGSVVVTPQNGPNGQPSPTNGPQPSPAG